jgi:hypothetical protein
VTSTVAVATGQRRATSTAVVVTSGVENGGDLESGGNLESFRIKNETIRGGLLFIGLQISAAVLI